MSQRPKSLGSLYQVDATDLTEDQMQAYSGGKTNGVIFLWVSAASSASNVRFGFPRSIPTLM
jgi:hypothetical protein